MDLFLFNETEKAAVSSLQIIAKFFRIIELCFLLIFFSWTVTKLPFAVRISGEFFGKLIEFIATPFFGFILCNLIIAALVAKPSQFLSQRESAEEDRETDELYEELVKSGSEDPDSERDSSRSENVETVYEDKSIITEITNTIDRDAEAKSAKSAKSEADFDSESGFDDRKVMLRSLSEKLKRECSRTQNSKLRRSETENCRNQNCSGQILYYSEDLSSEDFQRKIEEFIAKEKKFRREESSAIVLHGEC